MADVPAGRAAPSHPRFECIILRAAWRSSSFGAVLCDGRGRTSIGSPCAGRRVARSIGDTSGPGFNSFHPKPGRDRRVRQPHRRADTVAQRRPRKSRKAG